MTSPQIKIFAKSCNCRACVAITKQDLYVSAKSEEGADWRTIRVKYGPKPCQCGCGTMVVIGQQAAQKTGTGVRHLDHVTR